MPLALLESFASFAVLSFELLLVEPLPETLPVALAVDVSLAVVLLPAVLFDSLVVVLALSAFFASLETVLLLSSVFALPVEVAGSLV